MDEYCIFFDNQEENSFEHKNIHNKFRKMVEKLFDDQVKEMQIDENDLFEVIEVGLRS